jgi:hypothetical protein
VSPELCMQALVCGRDGRSPSESHASSPETDLALATHGAEVSWCLEHGSLAGLLLDECEPTGTPQWM